LLGACLAWEYWPALLAMASRWAHDPRYSHGYLVPVFVAFYLWHSCRGNFSPKASDRWWGVLIIALGSALLYAGATIYLDWIEAGSLVVSLAGVAVLLGGWSFLKRSWAAIGFLIFMLPLPYRVETALSQPLQHLATKASTYTLQTIGLPALSEGNIIVLDEVRIGVVDACSGLSMMYTFFAISAGMALVIRRPLLDKALILLSAIPIALVANVGRITLTGVFLEVASQKFADHFYHDLAGWLMMPFAMVLLGIEVRLLSMLLIEPEPDEEASLRPSRAGINPFPANAGGGKAQAFVPVMATPGPRGRKKRS
jgi:exosortase